MGWNPLQGLLGRYGSALGSSYRQHGHFARVIKSDGINLVKLVHEADPEFKEAKDDLEKHKKGELVLDEEKFTRHIDKITSTVHDVLLQSINMFGMEIQEIRELLKRDIEAEQEGLDKATAERLVAHLDESLAKIAKDAEHDANVLLSIGHHSEQTGV